MKIKMDKTELLVGSVGTGLGVVGTSMQVNELLQIISMIITIIGGIITFIVLPLLNWYKNAKADGKITKEEMKEGIKIIEDGTEKIKQEKDKGE